MVARWLPVLIYVGLIFGLSSLRRVPIAAEVSHLDKLVHFGEYTILGFLLARATGARMGRAMLVRAILIGMLVGVADELYQITVPGRDSSPADFAADSLGVLAGVTARWRLWRHRPGAI